MKTKVLATVLGLAAAVALAATAVADDVVITKSATQEAIVANYAALVDAESDAEYTLYLNDAKVSGDSYELVNRLLLLEAADSQDGGAVESFKLFELWGDNDEPQARLDTVVAALFKHDTTYVPFFCHRFKGLEQQYDDHTPCKAKVRELLAPIVADTHAQVVVADVEANYYGSNCWVTVYVGRYTEEAGDTTNVGEYLKLTFDILHEI